MKKLVWDNELPQIQLIPNLTPIDTFYARIYAGENCPSSQALIDILKN